MISRADGQRDPLEPPVVARDTVEPTSAGRRVFRRAWLVITVIVAAVSATWLYGEQRSTRREIEGLASGLATERARREALEHEVGEAARRLVAYRQDTETLGEVRRDQLHGIEDAVRMLEAERDASERIIATYGCGVALIQGTVVYEDAAGRPLRYTQVDTRGRPMRGPLGAPRMSADGQGPPVRTTFLGTGFLASADGALLTSRHVARPWAADPMLAAYLEREGVKPQLAQLRAFFPGSPDPVPLRLGRASETADLMALRVTPPPSAHVLPLDLEGVDAVPGRPVILLGYPGGLELLLARVRPALLEALIDPNVPEINDVTVDVPALLERLSRLGEIRPYPTWGRLTDKRPHQLSHDAETGIGGSGGPIFATSGRVIGLTTAVVRDFDSAALGVPIRDAVVPLGQARRFAPQNPTQPR